MSNALAASRAEGAQLRRQLLRAQAATTRELRELAEASAEAEKEISSRESLKDGASPESPALPEGSPGGPHSPSPESQGQVGDLLGNQEV